jgi:hypothetical protein
LSQKLSFSVLFNFAPVGNLPGQGHLFAVEILKIYFRKEADVLKNFRYREKCKLTCLEQCPIIIKMVYEGFGAEISNII